MKTAEQIASATYDQYTVGGIPEPIAAGVREWMRLAIEADRAQRKTKKVHIVFDGPPAHESGRFIETETPDGKGIKLGDWMRRPDGYWVLEIEVPA